MIHLGNVPASTTIYVPFTTYAGSTGASVTCSGLAVTDVEIYKNGSTTQRASDAGIALLDTDGIDFDAITGLHGFSIDLSDNTDASFYAVGSWYWVVVSAITVDSQTVTFLAATFRIAPAEGVTGYPKTDVHALKGDAQSATDLQDFADAGYDPATNKVEGVKLADTLTTYTGNTVQTGDSFAVVNSGTSGNAALKTLIDAVDDYIDTEVAAIKAKTDNLPSDPADASDIAASFSSIASTLATIASYIDTEVAAIKTKTDNLPADPADASDIAASFSTVNSTLATIAAYIDTEVAAIKAKTDQMVFTTANRVDATATVAEADLRSALGMASADLDDQLDAILAASGGSGPGCGVWRTSL